MVCSLGNWYYTTLVVPDSETSQLSHRDDAQINFLEMLAVVLLVETFGDLLSGNAVFCVIDNNGVLGSLVKGSCRAPVTCCSTRLGAVLGTCRVQSQHCR